jgi:acetyl esterase/lipase
LKRPILGALVVAVAGALGLLAVERLTPWPRALHQRYVYDGEGRKAAQDLADRLPAGITGRLDLVYDPNDPAARLDVFRPAAAVPRVTVVWIHGGGWLSGSKALIAHYARILAGKGFAVVTVDYALAPGALYPTPVRQVNAALGYLARNATQLQIEPQFVLAGDSAGAQIALQVATLIRQPAYARLMRIESALASRQLAGLLLYCGVYRIDEAQATERSAVTELWSYSGSRDFLADPAFATAWVMDRIDGDYPPAFIAVGNDDGLRAQSIALADALERSGVKVERLVFPPDHQPPVSHEFQFELERPEARLALERSAAFLAGLAR